MSVVATKTETRYVQTIVAVDAATDRIMISERDPANPDQPGMPMIGMPFEFIAVKPHGYVTGQAFTFTQTVESPS